MGTELFIKLSSKEKKRKFKTKCSELGYEMKEVVEMAVDEVIKNGKNSCFLK